MTLKAFLDLVVEHWVLMSLVLCPIVIVLMALAALSCEACGAPFGVFRRRTRTIDLCLRCAVLHDFRRATETRNERRADGLGSKTGVGDRDSGSGASQSTESKSASEPKRRTEDQRGDRGEDRRYAMQPTIELGVAGHRGPH